MEMDEHLAVSMVRNLVKNAFLHNVECGKVIIAVSSNRWSVTNTGVSIPLDETSLYERFSKKSGKSSESNGLGLSIVKSIAQLYNLDIRYSFGDNGHCFEVVKKISE